MATMQDSLVVFYHLLFAATIMTRSYFVAAVAGLLLGMSTSCAHNFFHQVGYWDKFLSFFVRI